MHWLKKTETDGDWNVYHHIRREVLFRERGRDDYNDSHPDERQEANTPFLLMADDSPIGTVRVDLPAASPDAVLRMVAVLAAERGKGHGRQLLLLVEEFARRNGRSRLILNSAYEAIGFYRKNGFEEQPWSADELETLPPLGMQMVKTLA